MGTDYYADAGQCKNPFNKNYELREVKFYYNDSSDFDENFNRILSITEPFFPSKKEEISKVEFQFIIDDSATYTNWNDFRSKEAMETYRKVVQKEKDKAHFEKTLNQKREEYSSTNADGKKKLEPSILDLEKRIPQLNDEINKLINETRILEIQELKK